MDLQEKYHKLIKYLQSFERVAVAFSGGVDSAFLLKAAADALGIERVYAVTAVSCLFPQWEQDEARKFSEQFGVRQIYFAFMALDIEGFRENPPNRCYLCKHRLFQRIQETAAAEEVDIVVEGSNMDDLGDYRPGLAAIEELGIRSPLRYAGLYKEEIRELSRQMKLPTWDKPSFACLASRFAYGELINEARLQMVEQAEQLLLAMGFRQMRVRMHGEGKVIIARIEVMPEAFPRFFESGIRERIYQKFKEIGFSYVTLDLCGYRTGSMNEILEQKGE